MQECFYVSAPKRFLAALQLFKSEDVVEITFDFQTGIVRLVTLLLSNVAMLEVRFIPHADGVVLPSNKSPLPIRRITVSTKHLLCTFGDVCKTPQCRYITLSPDETTLTCCAFDANNRESGHYIISCLEEDIEIPEIPTILSPTVKVNRGAHDILDLLGTVADTTVYSEDSKCRLVWNMEETALVRTRYLYTNPSDTLCPLRQMFIKSILQLLKAILHFLQRTRVQLCLTTDAPLHLQTVDAASYVRVHFVAAPMDEGSD